MCAANGLLNDVHKKPTFKTHSKQRSILTSSEHLYDLVSASNIIGFNG